MQKSIIRLEGVLTCIYMYVFAFGCMNVRRKGVVSGGGI